jgi:hypothetical protein
VRRAAAARSIPAPHGDITHVRNKTPLRQPVPRRAGDHRPSACNPSGVALSIVDACREIRERENVDTKCICEDPAIRLMVFQLAHLFGVAGAHYDVVHYINDEAACKERLAELGLKPFGAG